MKGRFFRFNPRRGSDRNWEGGTFNLDFPIKVPFYEISWICRSVSKKGNPSLKGNPKKASSYRGLIDEGGERKVYQSIPTSTG